MLNYEKMSYNFGTTEYEGKEFALIEQAKYTGGQTRIDNSIYVLEDSYNAECIDKECNKYIAYFEIINIECEIEDMCNWDKASYIVKL